MGDFLANKATIRFSRRILLHGDSYNQAFIPKIANIKTIISAVGTTGYFFT
jgi:hypothetical protein